MKRLMNGLKKSIINSEKIDGQFLTINDKFKEQEIKFDKMMDEKIDDLAVIVNRSFESVEKSLRTWRLKTNLIYCVKTWIKI